MELKRKTSKILAAIYSSFKTGKRTTSTVIFSLLVFFLFSFNTNIPWNARILTAEPTGFMTVLANGYASFLIGGMLDLGLVLSYSLLSGVALTNFGLQLYSRNIESRELGSILPGFAAAGCGCGVGFLGVIGVTGALGLSPFQGNLVRLLGIFFLLFALSRFGDSEKCDVEISYGW